MHKLLAGTIYIRASPDTCLERIQQRARAEENEVTIGYLNEVHIKYDGVFGAL